jgi:hypothetical protein
MIYAIRKMLDQKYGAKIFWSTEYIKMQMQRSSYSKPQANI